MSGIADSAVGAILEIPPSALQDIQKAERYIDNLQITSKRAADAVKEHWGSIATSGLESFIQKLSDAQQAMKGFSGGKIDFNINTQPIENKLNDVSNASKKTANDVSSTVQALAWNELDFTNINRLRDSLMGLQTNYEQLEATVKSMQRTRSTQHPDDTFGLSQDITNKIELLKEYIALRKKSEEQLKSKTTDADKNILDEQKRLLTEQLDLRKQINEQRKRIASGEITGSDKLNEEKKILQDLYDQYRKNSNAQKQLRKDATDMSVAGSSRFELANEKQRNELLQIELRYRQDLNKELVRANELTAQTQVSKARLGNTEEAAIQRQLNSDYKAMLNIIKEQGELKAKVASEGRQMTQQEIDLIAALAQRYKIYYDDIQRVAGAYSKMSEAAAKNFQTDKSEQLARNAIMLADAQNKAAEAAQKVADAQAKAAQQQADKDRSQAESDLNRLYTERLRLLKEKEQLENKALVNQSKGLPDLTAKENQLLSELTAKLQTVDSQIQTIGNTYRGLQLKAQHAFELPELRQAVQLQNQLNDALKSVDTNNAKQLTAEYKRLTAEAQKLAQSMREYTAAGGDRSSTAYQQLEAQFRNIMMQRRVIEMENVDEVNNYRQQRQTAAYQSDLSAFIQAEAQKTAEAKRQAEQQSNDRLQAYQKYLNTYQGAMAAVNKLGTRGGQWEDSYENRARVIKNLESAIKSLNKADADYEKKLKDLTDALNKLKNAQKEVSDAMKPTKSMVSPQDAINAAKNATTLKQLQDAYKQLQEVMKNTDPNSQKWRDMNTQLQQTKTTIDEIRKKMGELKDQTVKISGIVGQLRGQIIGAFSIGAITGFIKKMVEVRAQFELQRVALGAILQDKELADKTFLQVQQMALQSPFSIMQLERATKQIAAFGFEAQKLVPTMKMFADISAGLGVEIDRLVLVMGHLKARNFLEGTMVRQFTNMGFNILGELAKYYSEIEDRMISVGEVQDRVKKKMISFEDVEEVLKRVTSAGGMFYDMQKKQSDSLWGQMQRIKDAYDLMLNDIGKGHQSSISAALTAIRTLISNWRTVWNVMKEAGAYLGTYIAVTRLLRMANIATWGELVTWIKLAAINIKDFGKSLFVAKTYTNALSTAMKGLMSSTGIGLIVAAFAALATHIWLTKSAAESLQEELSRIGGEFAKNTNESIANFKSLSDTISDSTKTYNEREQALKELNRVYGDILPKEKLEWDYIIGLNGDYKDLTKTITEYYAAKEYQQKSETILGGEDAKQLQKEVEEFYLARNKEGVFGMMFPESVLRAKAEVVAKEISSGKIANSVDAIGKRIAETLSLDNLDLSKWKTEDYGEIDLHDITQTAERITDALGDITLASAMAENATMDLSEAFALMDANQLRGSQEDLEKRRARLESQIAQKKQALQNLSDSSLADSARDSYTEQLNKLNAEYSVTVSNLDLLYEAQSKLIARDFKKDVESELKTLTDVGKTYWDNVQAMKSLERQGLANSKEYKNLAEANKRIIEGNDELENQFGTKLPFAQLETCQTTYDVKQVLDDVAKKAYPTVAKKAIEAMSQANLAILKGKKSILTFLQDVGDGLRKFLPDNIADWIPDLGDKIGKTEKEIAALSGDLKTTAESADDANNSLAKLYSDRAKHFAASTGADIKKLDTVISKNMTAAETAKQLRSEAKKAQADVDSYTQSTNKEVWLKSHDKTDSEIEQMKKDIKGYKALAKELDGVEDKNKGGKGKDPILELWKNRIKALQDYYNAREKARKNLSASDTEVEQRKSFEQLWKDLRFDQVKGLSLNDLIAQGFDPKTLQDDFVGALKKLKDLIPDKYKEVKDELQRTISKEEIEIKFKVAEDERERLQKSITELFDNLALTDELSKLGVGVDLTYMVGGRPTTLADIRKKYEELMVDFANKSEEEQKIIKKMGEDLTKKEYDNRKKQLQNYVKYLAESMGERAQIEIKALQDVNKIREDAGLDAFSKEQAIMQRRKKMQEDLSKFDFDQLKGSDVYLSVFKDLERASKEQLQYVLNRLKELQSTFTNLSPSQVKAIASEMKKIEDVLADKDSVNNLGNNLKDAINYARKRNDLLKEQTRLQTLVGNSDKALQSAQTELYQLELNRNSIQDKSSDEWKEANDAVEDQQRYVAGLQAQIEALKRQLEEVTDEINDGEQAWNKWQKGISKLRAGMNELKSSFDTIFEGLDSMGLVNDAFRDTYESIGDILGGLDTFLGGLESMDITKPFSIITGSIKAIGGIFQTIGGFFGIGDKKKERDIKRLTEKVETLDKAYQRLEKSIENAYTFSDYNAGYKQMQQNLESQKRAYEEMIRLEESKKKTDDEKIKEYKDKLQEISDAQEELKEQRIEAMGSTTDYLSEAQSFVDAWLDAYKETGSGLDSLSESWEEFIENLFVKQAAAQLVSTRLKKVIDKVNAAIEAGKTDFDLAQAVNEAREEWKKEAALLEQPLRDLFGSYGLGKGTGELILSDLQKGIQNITEPQAAAIEAYLNSMRFAVFDQNAKLDALIATIQAQYGSGAENPVVTELKGIRGVLDNIDRRLASVINTQGRNATLRIGAN